MNAANALRDIANRYPPSQIEHQRRDIPRIAFNVDLIAKRLPAGARVADIGGGLGMFSPGCAAIGLKSVLVDDFRDPGNIAIAESVFESVHRPVGVEIISRDVIADGIDLAPESFDAITTFDSMEHWHHSPKRLFRQIVTALKPGGILVIGVPNCVNLRKRITVPLGVGKWSPMAEWYERDVFRGHVREPDIADLRYIARDLGLTDVTVLGRNWLGYVSRFGWVKKLTPLADRLLQPFPALCSDLYLLGHKHR